MSRPQLNVFTNIMLIASISGFWHGTHSHIWSISTCWIVGVSASFAVLGWIDTTAYGRKARKHGWPMWLFHVGNIVVHYIPLCFAIVYPPINIQIWHGITAVAIHVAWPLTTPDRGFLLNSTYIPLRNHEWCLLWTISTVTQFFWVRFIQYVITN